MLIFLSLQTVKFPPNTIANNWHKKNQQLQENALKMGLLNVQREK